MRSFSMRPQKLSLAKTRNTSNRTRPYIMPIRCNSNEEVVKAEAIVDSNSANNMVTKMMLASMKR